jgi:HAMP domain-containing protein
MTSGWLRLIGTLLVVYGLVGAVLLGAIGFAVAQPLDRITSIGASVGEQQAAALESLERASETIGQTAGAVRNMESSLVQAQLATQRAASLSSGMSLTMLSLAEQMQLSIFGIQPLITLYPSFEQSSQQLGLLAEDVEAIAAALDANRADTLTIAQGLDELGGSIDRLRVAIAAGPDVTSAVEVVQPIQLGMLALIGWLLVAALGSVLAGLACWSASKRARRGSIEPTA